MTNLAFVYGSLKRGFHNNSVIADQQFLGTAVTKEASFQMHSLGGFPGVVRGAKQIAGEVYQVTKESLESALDWLEGHPVMYKREPITVLLNGQEVDAWIYIYQYDCSDRPMIEEWL